MPRKTLAQSLTAINAAERKLESAKNQATRCAIALAKETARLEAKVQHNRAMLAIALPDIGGPDSMLTTVDQLIQFVQQKHIHQAVRDHNERVKVTEPQVSPRKARKSYNGPAHKNPDCPPVYDDALYHIMLIAKLPDTDKEFVFTSPRLDPVWSPPYYTGENKEYGPFKGEWELPHYPHVKDLEKKVFQLYRDMWRSHRKMISWNVLDPFWGKGTGKNNPTGSICFAPAGRILILSERFPEGRFIGSVNKAGEIEISTYCGADKEYSHLNGLSINDAETIRLLDEYILGTSTVD